MVWLKGEKVSISEGLEGQDDHFETLLKMFEDLGLATLDIASQPECDLLSFAQTAFFFGVITLDPEPTRPPPPPSELKLTHRGDELPEHLRYSTTRESSKLETIVNDKKSDDDLFFDTKSEQATHTHGSALSLHEESDKSDSSTTEEVWLCNDCNHPKCIAGRASKYDAWTTATEISALSSAPSGRDWNPGSIRSGQGSSSESKLVASSGKRTALSTKTQHDNDSLSSKITPFTNYFSWGEFEAEDDSWPHVAQEPRLNYGSNSAQTLRIDTERKLVGIVYLVTSPLALSPPGQIGELNLGIIINNPYRGKGFAREAIQLILKYAFEDRNCHRIQASLLSLSSKERLISLLTHLRFGHEGIKRQAFFNPLINEWQDVTTMAIVDIDWVMRSIRKPAPTSLWEELFVRHQREREELLHWEEFQSRLKRTASMETLRAVPADPETSGTESDAAGSLKSTTSSSKGKKRAVPSDWTRDPYDGSSSDADSEFGFDGEAIALVRNRRDSVPDSPTHSEISLPSIPRSTPPASSSGSDWDLMEMSPCSSDDDEDEEEE
ncbi:spermidine n1-acetyltransferase [Favolaschia claudopus]|uniref:Spermidine n1-acetyltransferase n=1 Tax=Favolaschia claudopus TaxID=2862362 RepID=A0AAW0D594_9AGAR